MPTITLPDCSTRFYNAPITALEVARDIGARLADSMLAAKINGTLVDASFLIHDDVEIRIITDRDPEGVDVIRHSTAHLLAHAVKALFPQAQVTIGPVIDNGFYYDFAFDRPFTTEDLTVIEAKMRALAKENLPIERVVLPREQAIEFFRAQKEEYKAKIIEDIAEGEPLSLYRQGDFTDLCRGPHVPSTAKLKVFQLLKVAGAYWRGDSRNPMLQRIYGTAWADQKSLDAYLHRLEEAEKRDHRKIGKQLDLFHLQEEAPGMPFWHAQGWTIYCELEQFIRQLLNEQGYQEVHTPQMLDRHLWERSGHWEKFAQHMFVTEAENRQYAVKPMNCPAHVQIFNTGLKSYRDLPLRLAEFGSCFRNEPSGALHGLMRCRSFVQDDAHIFCTADQIEAEVSQLLDLILNVYAVFGFKDIAIKLATRPEQRVGEDSIWDQAEQALAKVLDDKKLQWQLNPGEGAFYGPKIEFQLHDCLDRVWQCGTVQLDFNMPDRLNAHYIAEEGTKKIPIMIHRAILGSMERFIAILIEHYAGIFPLWLAPTQVVIMNITDAQISWCDQVLFQLKNARIRAICDLRNEKIGYKIREHTLRKVPYLVVIGNQEMDNQQIKVRMLNGHDLGCMTIAQFQEYLMNEIQQKIISPKEV